MNDAKTNNTIRMTTTEMFRPSWDPSVQATYRGNHTQFQVCITRDGDKVTVLKAWGHSGGACFHNREEKVYSIAEELNKMAVTFAELNENPKLDHRFTLDIDDDLPEGLSYPEWQ